MRENTALRFSLVDRLWAMKYGDTVELETRVVAEAWPPTGDEDRSDYGVFHAMALANGGHRPEESLTTLQRIERDLEDGGFASPVLHPTGDKWLIHRKLAACPRCRGAGHYRTFPASLPSVAFRPADVSMTDTVTATMVRCDHKPT